MIEYIPTSLLPERNPGIYPAGRVCGCGCLLSRSNPGPRCRPCTWERMPESERMAEVIDITPPPPAA